MVTTAIRTHRSVDTLGAHEYTGVLPSTLAYWRKRGEGPRWYKIGRRVMYDIADLDAFIDRSKAKASA